MGEPLTEDRKCVPDITGGYFFCMDKKKDSQKFIKMKKSKVKLSSALKKGEKSGFAKYFNRKNFLKNLHQKYKDKR